MTTTYPVFAPRLASKLREHPETTAARSVLRSRVCRCHKSGTMGDYLDPNTLGSGSGVLPNPLAQSTAPSGYNAWWGAPAPTQPSATTAPSGGGQSFFGQVFSAAGDVLGIIASRALNRIGQGAAPNASAPTSSGPTQSPVPFGNGGLAMNNNSLAMWLASQRLAAQPQPQATAPSVSGLDSKTMLILGGIVLAAVALRK